MADGAVASVTRVVDGGEPGYLRLPLRLGGGCDALGASGRVRRLGIERSYPCTLGDLPAARARLVGAEQRWPGASILAAQLLTVPTHSLVSAAERDEIANILGCGLRS